MAVNYSKQSERRAALIKGIAAYAREQKTLLRLARRYSGFTSADFDRWFYGRDQRRPKFSAHGIDGDTFLLGYGESGYSRRNFMLDLLKHMIAATYQEDGQYWPTDDFDHMIDRAKTVTQYIETGA